jgi:hypothetical protein
MVVVIWFLHALSAVISEARRYSGPRPDGGARSAPEDKTVIETQLDPC